MIILKKAREQVFNLMIPSFLSLEENHPPRPLCDVSFANQRPKNIDYNSILNECIIDTLCELSLEAGFEDKDYVPLTFELKRDYKETIDVHDLISNRKMNLGYIKSNFYIRSFKLFDEEVVFVIKPFFNDPYYFSKIEDKESLKSFKKAMGEILEGRNVQFVSLFQKYDKDLQIIPQLCGLNNLYLEDYIKKVLHGKTIKYFLDQIIEYNTWIEAIQSVEGYKFLMARKWDYIILDLKMWLDMNCQLSLDKKGFSAFLDRLDVNNEHNLEWFVSFYTSENIFSTIGYIPGGDNTFIVSGYLKSVEQLLTNLIIDDAKLFDYKSVVKYVDEDEKNHVIEIKDNKRDKVTLGNILEYVRRSDVFIIDEIDKDRVVESLEAIHKKRNDFLHKKIIMNYEAIKMIRTQTFIAMFDVLNALYKKDPIYQDKRRYRLKKQSIGE